MIQRRAAWLHLTELSVIEVLRTIRGWRWAVIALLAVAGAWWFSRGEGYGPGAAVHFPGGPAGPPIAMILFALAAMLLAADSIACRDRATATAQLSTALAAPGAFLVSRLMAVIVLTALPALVVTFWASVGAWRADIPVLWSAPLLYALCVILPVIITASAAGLLARCWTHSDPIALLAAALVVAPGLAWRLTIADPGQIFLSASSAGGVLIPGTVLLMDALAILAPAPLLMALAASSYPLPRTTSRGLLPRIVIVGRGIGLNGLLVLAVYTLPLLWAARELAPGLRERFAPSSATESGEQAPILRAIPLTQPPILHRDLTLSPRLDSPLRATLSYPPGEVANLALTFGRALHVRGAKGATLKGSFVYRGLGLASLDLAASDTTRSLELQLDVPERYRREFTVAWNPESPNLALLGHWPGAPVVRQPGGDLVAAVERSTAQLKLPEGWRLDGGDAGAGGISVSAMNVDARDLRPEGRFRQSLTRGAVTLALETQQTRMAMDAGFLPLFAEPIARLSRSFDTPTTVTLSETPGIVPQGTRFQISTAELDQLEALFPRIDVYENPTRENYYAVFARYHKPLVEELHARRFIRTEESVLTVAGLVNYLHVIAFSGGRHEGILENTRRDLPFVLWRVGPNDLRPFDVAIVEEQEWRRPVNVALAWEQLTPTQTRRLMAFHHMLRGVLGDEKFSLMLRHLGSHRTLNIAALQQEAEKAHGSELGWFFEQWLRGGALPAYVITQSRAVLIEESGTRALSYRLQLAIRNSGTGRMPVPWRLQTEGDPINGVQWIDAGAEVEWSLVTIDRPLAFEVDPDGWVAQKRPEKEKRGEGPRLALFKSITDL